MKIQCYTVGYPPENSYLLCCENREAVLIDPGADAHKLYQAVKESGCTLRYILLTHGHYDHIGAVQQLRQKTGAQLAVPEAEKQLLADPQMNLTGYCLPEPYGISDADLYLREGDVLTVGECTLQTLHTPGHTPGSSCYLYKGHLFAGDTLFYDSIGRTDFPGGDLRKMLASLRRLASLPEDTVVYSGHGESTTVGRECLCNPYMNGTVAL